MFLNVLSDDEKKAFLELAFKLANSDSDYSESEVALVNQYRKEMSLTREMYEIRGVDCDHCLKVLSKSTQNVKNIIYFELLALAMCDENLDKKEIELLDEIKKSFGIDEIKAFKIAELIKTLTDTYKEINGLLK